MAERKMKLEIAVAGTIAALLFAGAAAPSWAVGGIQALDKGGGPVKAQLDRGGAGGGSAASGGGGGGARGGGGGGIGGGFSGGAPSIQHRGGGGGAWRGGSGGDRAIVRREGSRHFRHSNRHRSRRGHRHGGIGVYVAPYDYHYYDYDYSCEWLRRRAIETGSRYWWRRYRQCIED
jgi:hypothetical protein